MSPAAHKSHRRITKVFFGLRVVALAPMVLFTLAWPFLTQAAPAPCQCYDFTTKMSLQCYCGVADCVKNCPSGHNCSCDFVKNDACLKAKPCAGVNQPTASAAPVLAIPIPTVSLTNSYIVNGSVSSGGSEEGAARNIRISWIPQYITGVYRYAVAIAGVIAATMLMIGGIQYLTAGGDSGRVSRGKERIIDSLLGLILIIGSYVVLGTVNPDLVAFRDMEMEQVEKLTYEVSPGIPENAPDPVDPTAPKQPPNIPSAKPTSGAMGSDNVPWFMQYDSKWNPGGCISGPCGNKATWMSDTYKARGDCTSIAQRGCGTTSLAMVLNFYGAGTDPMKTAAWGLGCKGGWPAFANIGAIGKGFPGFKAEAIGTRKTDITQRMNKVISLVNSGKPVIYNCAPCDGWDFNQNPRHYGGHYIVLTGYDAASKSFRVNDPGRGGPTRIRTITYDNVANNWVVAVYVHK